jgi:hypothetical protein
MTLIDLYRSIATLGRRALPVALFLLPVHALAAPCIAPDSGGTADLPALACGLETRDGPFLIENGLPAGTTIEIEIVELNLACSSPITCSVPLGAGICETAGGGLGGDLQCYTSALELTMTGTGSLLFFNRVIHVPVADETHSASRTPGDPVQNFATRYVHLQGEIFGDPDFCMLRIRAGSDFGLLSPGETSLTDLGNSTWNVDSFFDVAYEIEFIGCPGSALEGFGGVTQKVGKLRLGETIEGVPALSTGWLGLSVIAMLGTGCLWLRRRATARK